MKRRVTVVLCFILLQQNLLYSQRNTEDSLLRIVALNNKDDNEMKALMLLALNCFRNNPNKAKIYLHQNLQLAVPAGNFYRQSGAYSLLLSIHQEAGNIDSADWYVNKMRTVAVTAPDDKKVQMNYNQAVGLYYRKKAEYKDALPYQLAAAKYAEEAGADKKDIAGQWLNAGNTYSSLGDYQHTMVCFLKALGLFEEAGNKLGQSFCYNGLSICYTKIKQYDKAMEYAEKSLTLKKVLNDTRGICTSELAIGVIYMETRKLTEALKQFETVARLAAEGDMLSEEAKSHFNTAKIFVEQKKDSLAMLFFKKAKAISLQINDKELVADSDAELAVLQKKTGALTQAATEATLLAGTATHKEIGSLNEEAHNYKRLSNFYASSRQYEKALDNLNKYNAVKDSIAGVDIQVQLKKLEEQYNTAKKEQEITLLKKDKQLQKQILERQRVLLISTVALALLALGAIWLLISRNKLKQRMKELELRNQIAADLHDEVGSSLSSIHLLSQMAAQPGNDAVQKNILDKMSVNAKETMDKMSDLVWTIKPEEAEGSNLKQRMERFAYEICGAKNIEVDLQLQKLDTKDLTMEQRKSMYLIFKEALNNAVKYSGTSKVYISAANGGNMLTMVVKDEGCGFDSTTITKGNGLDNINRRAVSVGGSLNIHASPGMGTEVILTLPLKR